MELRWTGKAVSDLHRLHDFMTEVNPAAAAKIVRQLVSAPEALLTHPRLGPQLFQFQPREVRHLHVGKYEIRYEIQDESIFILRIWHTREWR